MHKTRIARAKALMAAQRRRSVLLFNDQRNLEMENNSPFPAAASRAAQDYSPWYRVIRNQSHGEIWILDDLGFNGIQADAFARELKAFGGQPVTLMLNSNGGDVFVGRAISSIIKAHNGPVTCKILGLAASIASVVALSCDKISMAAEAFYMVHQPWTGVNGNSSHLRKLAQDLDVISESLLDTYCARSRPGALDRETVRAWMNNETWINAEKALEIGWADTIETGAQRMAASLADKSRLKQFKNLPSSLAAAHSAGQDNTLWLRRRQLELLF